MGAPGGKKVAEVAKVPDVSKGSEAPKVPKGPKVPEEPEVKMVTRAQVLDVFGKFVAKQVIQ
jgi:hypothetical protein